MVMRDFTLRSSPQFGSLVIIRMFLDELVTHIIINRLQRPHFHLKSIDIKTGNLINVAMIVKVTIILDTSEYEENHGASVDEPGDVDSTSGTTYITLTTTTATSAHQHPHHHHHHPHQGGPSGQIQFADQTTGYAPPISFSRP